MRVKQFSLWSIRSTIKSVSIFYLTMVLLLATILIVTFLSLGQIRSNVQFGIAMPAVLFLFVAGIVTFGQSVRVGLANGVSRRSIFLGTLVDIAFISLAMTLLTMALEWIFSRFGIGVDNSIFEGYRDYFLAIAPLGKYAILILGNFVMLLLGYSLGLFIGGAYYRMNRLAKVCVSIGVPALFIAGLPSVYYLVPEIARVMERISLALGDFLVASPFNLMLLFMAVTVCALFFGWLLIRRAPIKMPKG